MFIFKLLFALVLNTTIFGGLLFLPAGTFNWWRAWVFLGISSVGIIVTMVDVFREDEALWNERGKPPIQPNQPLADKIVISLLMITFLGLMAFISLDVWRLHLFSTPSSIASGSGLILLIIGWVIIHFSYKENTFATTVVKHQSNRQQTVIDTGVYSIVRHPFYAGSVLWWIGMPLWLESYAGVLFEIMLIALLVIRIMFEEQFLKQELKDYDAYTKRVRYKLLPFIW